MKKSSELWHHVTNLERLHSDKQYLTDDSAMIADHYTIISQKIIFQLLNISRQERGNNVQVMFITRYKQVPMPAETLIDDLRLLNTAEQSAVIGYPVVEMKSTLFFLSEYPCLRF